MTGVTTDFGYQELDEALRQADWRGADAITFEIMLDKAQRQDEGWLDRDAIAQFPCHVLHQLDQRWRHYSSGHFGFSTQLQMYTYEFERSSFDFACKAGWTMTLWQPTGFFTFYDRLTFSLEAPRGHLPALWFWELPWYVSWKTGGFGTGRGGGFGNSGLFDAMMLRLERCQQI
jgi:hypothetical protein